MSNVLTATALCLNLLTLVLVMTLVLKPTKGINDTLSSKSVSIIPLEKLYSGSVPATVISKYGGRPWGNMSNFADPDAKWLWGVPNDYSSWLFFTKFTNDANSDIDVEIHLIIDQTGYLYIDGVSILECNEKGWLTTDYSKATVKLTPGEHIIAIYAQNNVGTGGVLASLIQANGTTLVRTDEKWSCKKLTTIKS